MVTFTDDVPKLISFPAHPAHVLKLVTTGGALFQCDGCRQYGDDEHRYRCEPCNFDLHVCCAPLREHLQHPFFQGRTFSFLHSPPVPPGAPAGSGRFCDACGDQVLGFVYHDGHHDLDLHPQCASLPERLVEQDVVFDLCKEAPAGGACSLCCEGREGRRGSFWCYCYHDGDGDLLYMHLACMMEACLSAGQASAPTRKKGRLRRFCKVVCKVARVAYAVTSMDPVAIVAAVVSSDELLG